MPPTTVRHRTRAEHRQAAKPRQSGDPGLSSLPMLRTSERTTFKRCHWKWWMEFEEDLHPVRETPPLRFGTLIHKALATYYKPGIKRGPNPARTFTRIYDKEIKTQSEFGFKVENIEGDEQWMEARELGQAMLNHYIEHYGADDEWDVIATEQPFKQLVMKPWKPDDPWFWYVGVLDGVWRNRSTKKICIVDHKTAAAINVMYLSLDSQATAYWTWGLDWIYGKGILTKKQKPAGMLYNHLRKAMPDDRPKNQTGQSLNKDGAVSLRQPPPYFTRTNIWRDAIERETARNQILAEYADMELIRSAGAEEDGSPPAGAYKNQGQFTCPGCWCFDMCELHEIGADWLEMRELMAQQWEPYIEHETYASETH